MTAENKHTDLEAFVSKISEVESLDDAKKFISVLVASNNSLIMLAAECVAHLVADDEGVIEHAHGDGYPVTTMLGIMEELGVCYKTSNHTWQLRKISDKLN